MYKTFAVFILASVSAQDEQPEPMLISEGPQDTQIKYTPAPKPYFSTDLADYDLLRQPEIREVGSFPLITKRVAWQLFDQRETSDIESWTKKITLDHIDDPEWFDWAAMAPNGYALQGIVLLDRELLTGEYMVAGLVYADEPDMTWSAYFGKTPDGNDFRTYMGLEFPEGNGLASEPNINDALWLQAPYPEVRESGIGGEIGQKYFENSKVWALWVWAFGEEETDQISFDAYVGQYSLAEDKYYAFTDSITVFLAGATQLGVTAAFALACLAYM